MTIPSDFINLTDLTDSDYDTELAIAVESSNIAEPTKKLLLSKIASSSQVNNLHTKRDSINWEPGLKVTDPLQLYTYNGVSYLPDPRLTPYTTSSSFANDVIQGRWGTYSLETQNQRLKDNGDIRGWGAIIGGTDDCSQAMQRAVSEVNAIRLPRGRIRLENKISIIGGMTIRGAGRWESILETYINDFAIEKVDKVGRESLDLFEFQMQDKLRGPNSAGVKIYSPSSNHFEGLRMQFYTKQAFLMQRSILGSVNDVNCGTCGTGVEFEDDGSFTVKAVVRDFQAAACGTAIKYTGTVASTSVDNVIIENCDIGIHADTSLAGRISEPWIEGCRVGFKLVNSSKLQIQNPKLPNVQIPYDITYNSSVPPYERGMESIESSSRAVAYAVRRGAVSLGDGGAWISPNLSIIESFYLDVNPGGVNPQKVRIVSDGLYSIDVNASFRNSSASVAKVAMRVLKNGLEVEGSYSVTSINSNAVNESNRNISINVLTGCKKGDDIQIQVASDRRGIWLDCNAQTAQLPSSDHNVCMSIMLRNTGIITNSSTSIQ